MLATIAAWFTSTLLPLLLQWLLVEVFLGAATYAVNEFFVDVVIKGGFQNFTGLTTYLSSLVNSNIGEFPAIDLFLTIRIIAFFIIALNMIVSGIRMMTASATGRAPESPVAFFARCAVAIIAIVLYPTIIDLVTKIMNAFLASPLFDVNTAGSATFSATSQANGIFSTIENIADNGIGGVFISIAVAIVFLKDIAFAAIIYIERYVSFALYLSLGPICIALYPSEAQKNVFGEWLKGILSQMFTILLSIMCITLFCRQVYSMQYLDINTEIGVNKTVQLVFAMALLELVKNSEQIVNMFGFRTIPSGDTARMFLSGVAGTFVGFSKASSALKKGESNLNAARAKTFGTGQAPKFESKNIATGGSEMGVSMSKFDPKAKLSGADATLNAINKNGGAPLSEKQMDKLAKDITGKNNTLSNFFGPGNNSLKDKYGLGTKDYDEVRKGIAEANNQYKSLNKTLSTDHPDAQACLNMRSNTNGLVGVGQASKLYFPPDKKGFSEDNPNADGSFMQAYMFKAKKAGQKDSEAETYVQYQQVRRREDGTIVPIQNVDPNLMREAQSMPIVPHQNTSAQARENIEKNIRNKDEYKGLTDEQLQSNPTYQSEVAQTLNDPNAFDKINYENQIKNNEKAKANIESSVRNSDKYKNFTDDQLQTNGAYQEDLQKAFSNSGIQGENTYSMPIKNSVGNQNESGQLVQLGVKELCGNEAICTNTGVTEIPYDYVRQEFVQNKDGDFELKSTLGNEIFDKNGESTSYSIDENGNMHSTTNVNITGSANLDKEYVETSPIEYPDMSNQYRESTIVEHQESNYSQTDYHESKEEKIVERPQLDQPESVDIANDETIYVDDEGNSTVHPEKLNPKVIYMTPTKPESDGEPNVENSKKPKDENKTSDGEGDEE